MQPIKPKTYNMTDTNQKRWTEDLFRIFQRNISFGHIVNGKDQNIDGKMVEIADTGLALSNNVITHNLNRIPLYIDVKYKSISGDWQDSGVAWTNKTITIQFTVDHMKVRLFIH